MKTNTHLKLDPSDLIRPALAVLCDPRYLAECSPRRLSAVCETIRDASLIGSRIFENYSQQFCGHPESFWHLTYNHARCEADGAIYNDINSRIHTVFLGEYRDYAKLVAKRWGKRSIYRLPVTGLRCAFCPINDPVRRKNGAVWATPGCSLKIQPPVIGGRKWKFHPDKRGTVTMPSTLQECHDVLGVPLGSSLADVQEAFCWRFEVSHPERFRDLPEHLQKLAETVIQVIVYSMNQIKASLPITL